MEEKTVLSLATAPAGDPAGVVIDLVPRPRSAQRRVVPEN